ncbi:MAG TPA: allophanate hydrolase [Pilimelia sp.]|nr:allophanate hydrolase [Pilimelia sp.]
MQSLHEIGDFGALRAAYAGGRLRPVDVVDLVLRRIAARGDDSVWISRVPPAALRRRAAALAGRDPADLPLYGVPFAVKDNIDVAGLPTTAGCPDFAYLPERTAPAVQRLLAAGGLLVGKTNLDQFATGLTGARSPYGACESVFGGGLIAGGSSSGSAVAVAAGLVSFALGTDTAGSGRVPAALNGIVGLKPTRGLLSTAGVVPACRSLDCVSIFATGVSEAAAVLAAARGVSPDDPWGRAPLPGQATPRLPATVRLGVPGAEDLDFFGDAGQRDRYLAGADRVAAHCAETARVPLGPFLEAGDLLYRGPWVAERLTGLDDFLRTHPDSVHPVTRRVLEGGRRFDAVAAFRAQHRLQELRAGVDRIWQRVDAIVLPTVGTTFTLAEIVEDPVGRNLLLGRYTQFANLLDLAVVTVPSGRTVDGRPASLSLVGPAFSEPTLLALAAAVAGTAAPPAPAAVPPPGTVQLAVVGRHLRGEPRNGELVDCGATLTEETRTAALYRLYRLGDPSGDPSGDAGGDGLPALIRVGAGGAAIEVEVWQVPRAAVGALLAGVPAPLSLGWVRLADGREVLGFLGETYAAGEPGAHDITASGGWRAYRAALAAS